MNSNVFKRSGEHTKKGYHSPGKSIWNNLIRQNDQQTKTSRIHKCPVITYQVEYPVTCWILLLMQKQKIISVVSTDFLNKISILSWILSTKMFFKCLPSESE